LRQEGYRSFIELVRANMRSAGGLRIDHVMGLQHLYWIPEGEKPSAGGYVGYPLDDLVGILALESHRNRCLVVGEDLGTVPEGFRERMADANILSYRVLYFEQDATGAFLPPPAYPQLALAVTGSHDLPTMHGWWVGRDIALKEQLGLFPDKELEAREQRARRARERAALLAALRQAELIGFEQPTISQLIHAAQAFLARSPCVLTMVQLDDITEEVDPVNVPGTSDEYPNWRRRLSVNLEQLSESSTFAAITRIFAQGRHRQSGGPHHD
jgi:4-alpha-glucanotransferase